MLDRVDDITTSQPDVQLVLPLGPPVYLTGRQLNALRRKAGPQGRGRLSERLRSGRIILTDHTFDQSRRLAGASYGYAWAARQVGDDRNISLVEVVRRRGFSDAVVDRFVERVGVDRVRAALDRATVLTTS